MNLQKALEAVSGDIDEVNQWAESEYQKYFAPYFKGQVELYNKLKKYDYKNITDQQLQDILINLPMELFSVSEQLSKMRTAQEVIKLHIKEVERDYVKSHTEGSETKRKEEASVLTAEDRLLVTVYDTIVERVTRQMTFSKELIMSAKKVWDARRADGIPMPDILIDNTDGLPEYKM